MYRRSSSKRTRWPKKTKYSNETYSSNVTITTPNADTGHSEVAIVTALNALGARKFKNPTLTISCSDELNGGGAVQSEDPIFFALVYVPEGLTVNGDSLNIGDNNTSSLYEPNQNVILQGLIYPGDTHVFSNRLGRNLDAGDTIVLLLKQPRQNSTGANTFQHVYFTCNYAISF